MKVTKRPQVHSSSVIDACLKSWELERRVEELEERIETMQKEYLEKLYSLQCKVISFQSQFIELLPTEEVEEVKTEMDEMEKNRVVSDKEEALERVNRAIERHEYKPVLQVGKTEKDG